ncbi:MAG TPA: EAL domain-containing protein [Gallionellaceae bacterium]|nr:EAL domain-containing protein [Gallionellaceae bacterium]
MNSNPPKELDAEVIRLREELLHRDLQLALFKEVVSAVRERFSLEGIFQMVVVFAQGLTKAETVLIPVVDEGGATYTYRAGCGKNAGEIVGESLDLNLGLCGWVWKHKTPWWRGVLGELAEEERNKWEKQVGTILLVPLLGRNHFLGGIACIDKVGGGDFDEKDLNLLTLLASQVATAIDNNSLLDDLEQANRALAIEKERAQTTLSSIGDAVITTDQHGRIEYINPAGKRLFGCAQADDMPLTLADLGTLLYEDDRQPVGNLVLPTLREGRLPYPSRTMVLIRADGREYYVEPNSAPIHDADGRSSGVALVFRDVSQARELTRQLSHQVTHDALTGLLNRREFEYEVRQAMRDVQVNNSEHSLLYMGLDQFKLINDTCGHIAGDELLRQYAKLLGGVLHPGDALARIGGDEFGLLVENFTQAQAVELAEQILSLSRSFRFEWDGEAFAIGISIGVIAITAGSESVMLLMSGVDAACQMAKEAGGDRVYVHHVADQALQARLGEMQWTPRINRALEEERMLLYCQPIIRPGAEGDLCSHYEILVRMQDEKGNIITPDNFLPSAERYNLIGRIDRWVISAYFRWLAENPQHLARLELGSVNLSGRSLGDDSCLVHIENMLHEYAIPPHKICFEITETEAIGNLAKAVHFIRRLNDMGCTFALDDFGSGLSSYAYLKNLPVDFLKIDGQFVRDMALDAGHYALVESINHVAHAMGRKTIAEFVENADAAAMLGRLGVDFLQGYGVAKPRPVGDMLLDVCCCPRACQ